MAAPKVEQQIKLQKCGCPISYLYTDYTDKLAVISQEKYI